MTIANPALEKHNVTQKARACPRFAHARRAAGFAISRRAYPPSGFGVGKYVFIVGRELGQRLCLLAARLRKRGVGLDQLALIRGERGP